jgi:hypothetical protein
MAQTPPPSIDPVPTPPIQRGDRTTFSSRVDAFITWLVSAVTQFGSLATNVYNNAVDAYNNAVAALGSANGAATSASNAATSASNAASSASSAATSASNAAVSAASLIATSSTDLVIGTGTKVFTDIPAGKSFQANIPFTAVDPANSTRYITGTIVSYSPPNLTVNVVAFGGSGTVTDWNISVSGTPGQQGPAGGISGGNAAAAIEFKKGSDVASATTPDIWGTAPSNGNYLTVTGTSSITGYPAAPQAGAMRRYIAGGALTLVNGANHVVKGGVDYTCQAGDEIEVWAETTTKFRVTVHRANGFPMVSSLLSSTAEYIQSSGIYTAKKTGWHFLELFGAGGRGAAVYLDSSLDSNQRIGAVGGGSGAIARGWRYLIKGQSYPVSIGSSAPAASVTTAGTILAGADGGDTSFSGSGIATMTAGGGKGGTATAGAVTVPGALGGTASGGDENIDGASSGSAQVIGTGLRGVAVTGGASPGLKGTAYSSGNAVVNQGATADIRAATGGAAVGGASANATATSSSVASKGAGAGGPSTVATSGANFAGTAAGAEATFATAPYMSLFNATAGGDAATSRSGAGTQGSVSAATTVNGGNFGGSGAVVASGSAVTSGDAGYGAGSGAAVCLTSGATAGASGKGLIVIRS